MTRVALIACFVGLVGLASACKGDRVVLRPGQVLLYFDTDAPVPASTAGTQVSATPLFDRLLVDLFRPGETSPCAGCVNEFEINTTQFEQRRVSIGIATPFGTAGTRVRARLLRTAFTKPSGEHDPDSTIEVTAALPVVDKDDIVERTLLLRVDGVGVAHGSLEQPEETAAGRPERSLVGSWPGARRSTCEGTTPAGAACVPGGAYWMGNPRGRGFFPQNDLPRPRLIALSPFFVSQAEVTVREYREAGFAPAIPWTGSSEGATSRDWCTFTASSGPFDALPVNCVTREEARAYCTRVGGELPTEAQLAYLQGGLESKTFPWGEDEPNCQDAVFGRGGWGVFSLVVAPCRPPAPIGSPSPPGSAARDHLDLAGGRVVDLAGNISEWARDAWNRNDEPCWSRPGIYVNPVCDTPSPKDGELAITRGGNWSSDAHFLVSYARTAVKGDFANVQAGFRCVWPSPAPPR